MNSGTSQNSDVPKHAGSKQPTHPVVDWSEVTVEVNGTRMTVLFPDEEKPLEPQS